MAVVMEGLFIHCFLAGRLPRQGPLYARRKSLHVLSRCASNSPGKGLLSTQTLPPITLTNSLSRKKETLRTSDPSGLTWYCCGPTVYDSAHMGHAYTYVQFDLIRRFLEDRRRMRVRYAVNVTDIDDKIIAKANEKGVVWLEIAKHYEKEFLEDMESLNVKPPNIVARISDFIPQAIHFVEGLLQRNLAYIVPSGSVYFDTRAYGRSGKFKPMQEDFSFVGDYSTELRQEKNYPADFALWKSAKPREPAWSVPFSPHPGRPGWHIECSTVASHFFGSSVDLHSGGIDLMFPHHENEESQCCALHGVDQWVKQWLHTGHLLAPDESKMSKSLKNSISIRDFLKKHSAMQFRMFCMMQYYRSHCALGEEELRAAHALISRLTGFLNLVEEYRRGTLEIRWFDEGRLRDAIIKTEESVDNSLADDFNFPQALYHISELVSFCHKQIEESRTKVSTLSPYEHSALFGAADFVQSFFDVFGLKLPTKKALATENRRAWNEEEVRSLEEVMDAVVQFRNVVRQTALGGLKKEPTLQTLQEESKKLLKDCDNFRDKLLKMGFRVKDHGKLSTWEKLLKNTSAVEVHKPARIKSKA